MRQVNSRIRSFIVRQKNNYSFFRYIWLISLSLREKKERKIYNDKEALDYLYNQFSGRYPNIDNPSLFSEKMQWLKLHYRNELMPIVGDKYEVREYLESLGKGYLLNDLIKVYDNVSDIKLDILPNRFVLKATHSSGWNLIVKDKAKINWTVWKLIMRYWLKHKIDWNGREWHYAEMKPRIVCEKYLEDASGDLMDYKFYCFNGEPKFLQVNVGRGHKDSTQNYYDLEWNLLPFGKSQPHNPSAKIEKPLHFQEMIKEAKELSKPFPYVRMDFYEANGRLYFGEFTFFPASGLPDFIPSEWDQKVGELLVLPEPNN